MIASGNNITVDHGASNGHHTAYRQPVFHPSWRFLRRRLRARLEAAPFRLRRQGGVLQLRTGRPDADLLRLYPRALAEPHQGRRIRLQLQALLRAGQRVSSRAAQQREPRLRIPVHVEAGIAHREQRHPVTALPEPRRLSVRRHRHRHVRAERQGHDRHGQRPQ